MRESEKGINAQLDARTVSQLRPASSPLGTQANTYTCQAEYV